MTNREDQLQRLLLKFYTNVGGVNVPMMNEAYRILFLETDNPPVPGPDGLAYPIPATERVSPLHPPLPKSGTP